MNLKTPEKFSLLNTDADLKPFLFYFTLANRDFVPNKLQKHCFKILILISLIEIIIFIKNFEIT